MSIWKATTVTLAMLFGLWVAFLIWDAAQAAPVAGTPASSSMQSPLTFPTKYDATIKKASERWLPGIPWKLLKAQLYQESRLDPSARSPVGAEGVAQFMPATWREVSHVLGFGGVGRSEADPAIQGAAYYMAQMKRLYPTVDELEKHRMGAASYNAGGGNIKKARSLCGNPDEWPSVAVCLPKVTGKHSEETIIYVTRIWHWWEMMEAGL